MAHVSSRVVEVCVFKYVRQQPLYLVLKRSAEETLYPGVWQIVTGMLEESEHTVAAALRELREETGFRPQRLWVTPYVDTFYSAASDHVNLTPVCAAQVKEDDEPKLSDEHQEYAWLTYDGAIERLVWRGQKNAVTHTHTNIVGDMEDGRLAEIKDFSQYESS
ncbi:MAG: NUDIX domain-containing protein [Ignavibacteriae bacterium]|nr:NUDIX domain-containing protein [Ignavibacteriota bacterium]